jgi:hypothetical protein
MVHLDARPRAPTLRHRDLDGRSGRGADPPQRGRRGGSELPRTAGEDGGHPASVRGKHPVPHRVDAPVDRMQPADLDTMPDGSPPKAELAQLRSGDDAVLPLGARRRADRGHVSGRSTPMTGSSAVQSAMDRRVATKSRPWGTSATFS